MKELYALLQRLPSSCRRLVWIGLVLSGSSALLEVLMLASAVPFLSLLAGAERSLQLQNIPYSGARFAALLLLATAFRLFSLWFSSRSAAQVGQQLATRVMQRYLCLPYELFLLHRSSEISATAIQHSSTVALAFRNFLQFIQAALVTAALAIGLALLQPVVAASLVIGLGVIYLLLLNLSRRFFDRFGAQSAQAASAQLQAVGEALGAIRDIQLDGAQRLSVQRFSDVDLRYRLATSWVEVLAAAPRYVLEAVLLLLIIGLAILLVFSRPSGSAELIGILGAFALGGQRIIPSLQQCYASLGVMRAAKPALLAVQCALNQDSAPEFSLASQEYGHPRIAVLKPQSIRFDTVHYAYPGAERPVFDDFNLELRCGERLGILGQTGVGKSTLLDLLMGLLVPQSGSIWVDQHNLHGSAGSGHYLRRFRQTIAHVPQQVFIADATILSNIAFGEAENCIDRSRVVAAARQAQLDQWIESLPLDYNTPVGERGSLLSGGQRQRLGIARALYKGASLLILDEATSALDRNTEIAVLQEIEKIQLEQQLTVVMVAHRLVTLAGCDRILELQPATLPPKIYAPPFPSGLLESLTS
jgi:ABC-type multidrug transport system fused ATPase/permease subunit